MQENQYKKLFLMGLEDLNEKLYGRDIHLDRATQHTPFDPGQTGADSPIKEQFQSQEFWQKPVAPVDSSLVLGNITKSKRTRKIAISLGVLAFILLIGGTAFKVRTMLFSEDQVKISLSGPKDVASSEGTMFTITYTNNNWAALSNASIFLSYPETFQLQADSSMKINGPSTEIMLGEIPAHTEKKITVKGKFYESKGEKLNMQVTLRYSPKRISSVLEKKASFTVTVASSPLLIEITAPLEIATGQDVEYVIDYANKSDKELSNLRVKLTYPEGFRFVGAEPRSSEGDSTWYVGDFGTNGKGKIVVRGVLTGTQQEYKNIRATIGYFRGDGTFISYGTHERQTQMVASPLSISQTVNGLTDIAVKPGDVLAYVIRYKNDGNIGLRDAILMVEIDPTFLDMSQLRIQNGMYDASRKVILWKASDVPSLGKIEPGASDSLSFSVPVLNNIPLESGKSLFIKTVAKIDSPDIPATLGANKIIGSNTLLVKLKSSARLNTSVFYTDATFPNSGPVPPVVGQETSYTIHLSLVNTRNDLNDARVVITLPTGIRYREKYSPNKESLVYNERSNEIVWNLGTIFATQTAARELILQVSTVPGPQQRGKTLMFLNSAVFTAKDAFTGQNIRVENEERTSVANKDSVFGDSFVIVAAE